MSKSWFAKQITIRLTADGFLSIVSYTFTFPGGTQLRLKRVRAFATESGPTDILAEQTQVFQKLQPKTSRDGA